MKVTIEQIRWFRLRRSGLVMPFRSAEEAARELAGIQAQILSAAGVSTWNRTAGLSEDEFTRKLYADRTLLKLWGQRGTLHLYPTADWPLIYAAHANLVTWWQRQQEKRTGETRESYEKVVARAGALLRERGTLTRADLRTAFPELMEEHFSGWGGLFAELVHRGVACHAEPEGSAGSFAHRDHWLPELAWEPPDFDAANVELARRYFRAYGPATERDFRYWRGAKAAQSRRWVRALRDELVEDEIGGENCLLFGEDAELLTEEPPEREAWPVRLLYRFDPLLLGIKDKGWLVDDEHYGEVWRPAGHVEGTVLEHGRIAGTWRYDRRGGGLVVTVRPFAPLPEHARSALEGEAAGVAEFFGMELIELMG